MVPFAWRTYMNFSVCGSKLLKISNPKIYRREFGTVKNGPNSTPALMMSEGELTR
jgi:hypothetical protein